MWDPDPGSQLAPHVPQSVCSLPAMAGRPGLSGPEGLQSWASDSFPETPELVVFFS